MYLIFWFFNSIFNQISIKLDNIIYKQIKNKLYLLELEKNETLTNKLKNNDSINFGSQIRSYILEPYKLVKDYRTNFESNDPDSILNGEIMDMLIYNVKEIP